MSLTEKPVAHANSRIDEDAFELSRTRNGSHQNAALLQIASNKSIKYPLAQRNESIQIGVRTLETNLYCVCHCVCLLRESIAACCVRHIAIANTKVDTI